MSNSRPAVNVYLAYVPEDEDLLKRLRLQLKAIERIGLVDAWHDGEITAGADREKAMMEALHQSPIILLLVSSAFIASEFAYEQEVKTAMELHAAEKARVVPVILKPCMWRATSFGKLNPCPANGIPVMDDHWQSVDHAFMEVAEQVLKMIEEPKAEESMVEVPVANSEKVPSAEAPPAAAQFSFPTILLNGQHWMAGDLEGLSPEGKRVIHFDFKTALSSCPPGWRLPSKQEWQNLSEDQVAQLNLNFNGVLDRGSLRDKDRKLYYWTSDRSFGGEARCFEKMVDGSGRMESRYDHWGLSCRCIKED